MRHPVLRFATAALLAAALPSQAQAPGGPEPCGTDAYTAHRLETDAASAERMAAIERFTERFLAERDDAFRAADPVITIPVVVHVVYNTAAENVTDAQILSQIDVLNEDFRKANADTASTLAVFAPLAADLGLEFCLATVDPAGAPTTGILRTATAKSSFSPIDDDVKTAATGGSDPWPSGDYLNLWVCDIGSILGGEVLGYATFPGGPAALDGVVVDYTAFGRQTGSATPPYDLGRATTHEVGHWLNLRHTWGNCSFFFCCSVDDLVADTPDSDGPNNGCPLGATSCGSLDMVQNFMDYSDDDCSTLFTLGQEARARALFAPGGPRESLLSSAGCGAAPACAVPANPQTAVTGPTSATVSWDPVPGAVGYTLQGREVGGGVQTVAVSGTSRGFGIFSPGGNYQWRVQANCAASSSLYTGVQAFTTPLSREGHGPAATLLPNPATDRVRLDPGPLPADWTVHDAAGRRVAAGHATGPVDLDLSGWSAGVYVVSVSGSGTVDRLRLLVR